jgi:hypothetical protein
MADSRGKLVILGIFAMAIGLAGYAWWHHLQAGRRSAHFWGAPSAVQVRYAPQVEFLPLRPLDPTDEPLGKMVTICGTAYSVGDPVEVTGTRGLVHARHALVDDLSYAWSTKPADLGTWEFLLRFRNAEQTVTVAFDTEQGRICYVEQSKLNQLIPKIALAFRQKRDEWRNRGRVSEKRAS